MKEKGQEDVELGASEEGPLTLDPQVLRGHSDEMACVREIEKAYARARRPFQSGSLESVVMRLDPSVIGENDDDQR